MMGHIMMYLFLSWLNRNITDKVVYVLHWFIDIHVSFIKKVHCYNVLNSLYNDVIQDINA